MQLTLSRKNTNTVMIQYRLDHNGTISEGQSGFKSDKHYAKEFSKFPKFYERLVAFVRAFKDSEKVKDETTLEDETAKTTYSLRLRPNMADESASVIFDNTTLMDLWDEVLAEKVDVPNLILWDDKNQACAVDVDYHNGNKSFLDDITMLLRLVTPAPSYAWVTKSGGLRLIYFADETATAYEYAVLAMLCIKHHDANCTVEFKADTWHPKSVVDGKTCGEVIKQLQTFDDSILTEYLGTYTVDKNKIEDYLNEQGLEIGGRYAHSLCPINPTDDEKRSCVHVTENGIYCYACNAEDRYYGNVRKTPGFVPYGLLLRGSFVSLVNDCVTNFVHYNHAKFVLSSTLGLSLSDQQSETLYRILLKKRHGIEKQVYIDGCFNPALGFVRLDRDWRTLSNEACDFKEGSPSLKALPVTWYVDEEGKVKADAVTVERLTKPHDLSRLGYIDLQPTIGLSLYNVFNTDPNPLKVPFVYQLGEYNTDLYKDRTPRYLMESERKVKVAEAYDMLRDIYPEIDVNIVKLLLAVRGLSEVTDGHANHIFIRGSTGSGKTAIVQIASSILGDNAIEVAWLHDSDDLRRRISESKSKGSFIMFNEIIKAGRKKDDKQPTSLKFLLNLSPRETYHRLYFGPTQMGRLPVICMTDTDVPVTLMVDRQIGRRVIYIEAYGFKRWDESLRKHNMNTFYDLRLVDPIYAEMCNVILSDVVDTFFLTTDVSHKHIVHSLGFSFMHETEIAKQGERALVKFYNQWKAEKSVDSSYHPKWFETKGAGWRIIDLTCPENELTEQWLDLCDGSEGYDRFRSERIIEAPWNTVLDLPNRGVKCITERKSGSEIAILFCEESSDRKVVPLA
jgi:hypothetical protein